VTDRQSGEKISFPGVSRFLRCQNFDCGSQAVRLFLQRIGFPADFLQFFNGGKLTGQDLFCQAVRDLERVGIIVFR
jgi:hypothetical protein